MPYIDYKTEDTWQKRLFDKLMRVEDKLDRLLVLQNQSVDTTVRPPLKPEYLDIIDVSQILKVEQKTIYNCKHGKTNRSLFEKRNVYF